MNDNKPKILVTGGSGFIGSHLVKKLLEAGFKVYFIDIKSSSEVKINKNAVFCKGSILDEKFLDRFFKKNKIDVVMHLAALIRVDESSLKPKLYFENNVKGSICLLEAMRKAKIDKIAFASSAAVYGDSIYGLTKKQFEEILKAYSDNYGISSISFRIFNASGADPSGEFKERHNPETHLIPNVLKLLKEDKPIIVFGNDYNTKDGTCVRDYVHVSDICDAFIAAIPRLSGYKIYDISSGNKYSVKEIISLCSEILQKKAKILVKPKRKGDASYLIGNNKKIKSDLKWKPKYGIKEIISHAINALF